MSTAESDREFEQQKFVEDYIESLTWSESASHEIKAIVGGNLRAFWSRVQGSNNELRKRYTEARQIVKRTTNAWYRDEFEEGESASDAMSEALHWLSQEELEDETTST